MAKKNKENKKRILLPSILLLIALGSFMGIGAWIGSATKDDPDYIYLNINGKRYGGDIFIGNDSVSDEAKSLMIENQFLSLSLFGESNFNVVLENGVSSSDEFDFLLENNPENNDWNSPFLIYDSTDDASVTKLIANGFAGAKFFTDTKNQSVYNYLYTTSETSDNSIELIKLANEIETKSNTAGINYEEVDGLELINNTIFSDSNLYERIIIELSKDTSYQNKVLNDIYVYTYLWQDTIQKDYDFNLTRELVSSQASFVSAINFDLDKALLDTGSTTTINEIKAITDHKNGKINPTTWNNWMSTFLSSDSLVDDTTYDDFITTTSGTGYRGLKGIVFDKGAGGNIESDWTDTNLTWKYEKYDSLGDPIDGSLTTQSENNYSNTDILSNGNLYLSDEVNGASGEGALISDGDEHNETGDWETNIGTASVYVYSQLTPYIFKTVNLVNEGVSIEFNNPTFSLFAKGDNTTGWQSGSMEDHDEYIFERWFGNSLWKEGEIYVVEALINHNTNLKDKAIKKWNEEGFNIELSGKYEKSFGNYISENLIK